MNYTKDFKTWVENIYESHLNSTPISWVQNDYNNGWQCSFTIKTKDANELLKGLREYKMISSRLTDVNGGWATVNITVYNKDVEVIPEIVDMIKNNYGIEIEKI